MTFSNMKCGRSPQLYHRWKELCSPSGLPGSSKAVVIAAVLCVCVCVCVCVCGCCSTVNKCLMAEPVTASLSLSLPLQQLRGDGW